METPVVVGLAVVAVALGLVLWFGWLCFQTVCEALRDERSRNEQLLDRLQSGSLGEYTQAQLARESSRRPMPRIPTDLVGMSSNGTRMGDTAGVYDGDDE